MDRVVYSTPALDVRTDLGLSIVLENVQHFTQGKGDPKAEDFVAGSLTDRLETRLRCGKIKMPVAHMTVHSSMEQALKMWQGQIIRELNKLEESGAMLVMPKSIDSPKAFATAILVEAQKPPTPY